MSKIAIPDVVCFQLEFDELEGDRSLNSSALPPVCERCMGTRIVIPGSAFGHRGFKLRVDMISIVPLILAI